MRARRNSVRNRCQKSLTVHSWSVGTIKSPQKLSAKSHKKNLPTTGENKGYANVYYRSCGADRKKMWKVLLILLNVFFSFHFFQQDVDALGTLNVQPTFVKVKTHVPYYNLKVTLHRTGIVFEDLGLF